MNTPVRLCALLACFNRRDKTLACLRALQASTGVDDVRMSAILVDDGCTDGTAEAVAAEFPWVRVLRVGASEEALFWCRGMHRAFSAALEMGHDHYLWLNDDTMLERDAVARLLAASARLRRQVGAAVIVVGSTRDAATGTVTYGGERRPSAWRPFRVERLQPASTAQRCDSMTGNIVLIPADVALRVGNIDAVFEHSMGDTDYALRARRRGVQVWVDAGTHGACSDNSPVGTWCDASQPLRVRWRDMLGRKGLPWRSWLVFTRRHAGPLWPIYFASPYVKVLAQGLWRAAFPIRQQGLP
jgi:GT2 family glycosyltransferase